MVHCWNKNAPFLGWEALASCANPSAMLNKFDWNSKSIWLKVKSSLTETQVKFDWNLMSVWLKVKLSFSQTGEPLGLDWRAVSMGLRSNLSRRSEFLIDKRNDCQWESNRLSLRNVLIVNDNLLESHWDSLAVTFWLTLSLSATDKQ